MTTEDKSVPLAGGSAFVAHVWPEVEEPVVEVSTRGGNAPFVQLYELLDAFVTLGLLGVEDDVSGVRHYIRTPYVPTGGVEDHGVAT